MTSSIARDIVRQGVKTTRIAEKYGTLKNKFALTLYRVFE